MKSTTIKNTAQLIGIGIHSGLKSKLIFMPNDNLDGIFFVKDKVKIKADVKNVSCTQRGTNLKSDDGNTEIATVEHILSAISGLGITDILVEIQGIEPPIIDGSSLQIANTLQSCGILEFKKEKKVYGIDKTIMSEFDNGIRYQAEPCNEGLVFKFIYEHSHSLIGLQEYEIKLNVENYLRQISPARTFGFEDEISYLRKHNLAKGGRVTGDEKTDNAVIIKANGYSSELRFPNELVRHKILDIIGDLRLIPMEMDNIKFTVNKGGHKYNVKFAKTLIENLRGVST